MYSNVDSLLNKKDELLTTIDDVKPSIIGLTEIKPKGEADFTESQYCISNYDMFISKNPQRGAALYTERKLNARECPELNNQDFKESVWCSFSSASGAEVLLGCIYRSPNTSTEDNNKLLFNLLKSDEVNKYDKVCIVGDFNYPKVSWDGQWRGEKSNDIVEKVHNAFLIQKVENPTRRRPGQRPTMDDWVLVNEDDLISKIEHSQPIGKSDHDVLKFQLYIDMTKPQTKVEYRYDYNKGDYNKLKAIINDTDWDELETMDTEKAWNKIKQVINDGVEECVPKVKVSNENRLKPIWLNKYAIKKIKKKHNTYQRYLKTKKRSDYNKYISVRNECDRVLKRTRKEYEKQIAKESKYNPKKFWKYVKERTKASTGISPLKDENGKLVASDIEKAEVLNKFFASVFTAEDTNNLPDLQENSRSKGISLTDMRVTPAAVEKKLQELNPNKAKGPDKISPRILKELSKELAKPLCVLFNKTLETGMLPKDWKTAEVKALFKKGNKNEAGNYRPVSLTCIICKVIESLVRDCVVSHFEDNDLYAECQHGFRGKRSCVTQLLEVIEDFTEMADNGDPFDIVYLDFRKAFDSVPHERLIIKLAAYGINGKVLQWIRSFLAGRTQKVKVGKEESEETDVKSGIPQGSVLGPILFTVFINDLPESLSCYCKIFADDTKIYNKATNGDLIQEDLKSLQRWSDTWNLYFNVAKCHVMHIGARNTQREYSMKLGKDVQKISVCETEKDLGVTFDKDLSFDPHIDRVVKKANQMIGIIKRTFSYLDRDTFLKLYKAFVRPHLEYANVIWNPYLKRQSEKIEEVQRRATRLLKECKEMKYKERLDYLNLHSLKGRRVRGDLLHFQTCVQNNEWD